MSPATNCRITAESMLFTHPLRFASAWPRQGSVPTSPALYCRITAESMLFTRPLQSASPVRVPGVAVAVCVGVGVQIAPTGPQGVGVAMGAHLPAPPA